jgi:ATP-dependent RNA helicase HelY
MSQAREEFLAGLRFVLDPFQLRALDALDEGHSLLVAAPTGSGKTVVAEYAVEVALRSHEKAFYTTPLKALSNQKYADLVRRHGNDRVGLLTGDNSINGDAPVVVMTTEVLRNMVYAGSRSLERLRYVVLDEVHYLQNPYRGAVWEEVIVHAPQSVDLICLSATVSNAEEFAAWIATVRGSTLAVIEERRPVELKDLYLVGDRASEQLHLLPTFVNGRPNPEAAALDVRARRSYSPYARSRRRLYSPRRGEVVERLAHESMLPAIYFIFSRAGCDDAVRRCLHDGIRLTTPEERAQIRAMADARLESLSDADLRVLDHGTWIAGLEAGLAAHHAGLVPPFKEVTEACFEAALVKVVFATETLSLGVNMPARTVVIESLTKFTGERHERLTPGEYTQLTGRAGRRGTDDVGYAAVLWSPFVPFSAAAGLASTRSYELRSSFRPTYNMAANLVRRYSPEEAHHLLNLSFAQYRSDADVVALEAELARIGERIASLEETATCHLGDVEEYRALRREARSRRGRSSSRRGRSPAVRSALEGLRPGDVLSLPGKVAGGLLVVVSTSRRRGGEVRLAAVSVDTRRITLGLADFSEPPSPVARLVLPTPYDPRAARFVRESAAALRRLGPVGAVGPSVSGADVSPPSSAGASPSSDGRAGSAPSGEGQPASDEATATRLAAHPVGRCPDARRHLRALEQLGRARVDRDRLRARVKRRGESLSAQLDRVLSLLGSWGYVEGWSLTRRGDHLARLYHESDLLVAAALDAGLMDGLDAPDLAAVVSFFTFEARSTGPSGELPSQEVRRRLRSVESLAERLAGDEDAMGLPMTRPPDPGFAGAARAWTAGRGLAAVVGSEAISGGDFVRNVKQLVDLLRQLGDVAPDPRTARVARQAAGAVFRDVVAASSVVEVADSELSSRGEAAGAGPSATAEGSGP